MKKSIIFVLLAVVVFAAIAYYIVRQNQNDELTAQDYITSAESYLEDKEYSKALEQYKYAINSDPSNSEAYIAAANIYELKSNYKEAIELLVNGEQNAANPEILDKKIGELYYLQGEFEEAVMYLEKSNKANRDDIDTLVLLVKTYSYFEATDQTAIEVLENVSDQSAKAYKNYYLALYQYDDINEMMNLLSENFDSQDEEILQKISDLLKVVKRFKSEEEDVIQNNTFLAYELIKAELYTKAINVLDNIIEDNDEYYAAYMYRGVCYMLIDNLDQARKDLMKATEIEPDQLQPWVFLAQVLSKQSNQKEAIEAYEKALSLDKDNEEIRYDYVLTLENFGLFTQARVEYSELIDYGSNMNIEYQINAAFIDLDNLEKYEEGLVFANSILDNLEKEKVNDNKLSARVYDLLGWAYQVNGKKNEALKYLNRANDVYPYLPSTYYHLGVVSQEIDNLVEAQKNFERAVDLDLSGEIGAKANHEISKLNENE